MSSERASVPLSRRKDYDEDDPLIFYNPKRMSSRVVIGIVISLSLIVIFGIGVLVGSLVAPETAATPSMNTLQDRLQLFNALKQASNSNGNLSPSQSDFVINPNDYRKYLNGQNRRPTDPATPQEISAALALLFGTSGNVSTLAAADALSQNTEGWEAFNSILPAEFRIYPEEVTQLNQIPGKTFSVEQAQTLFLAQLQVLGGDMKAAHAWLRSNDTVRASLTWATVVSTASHVVDRDNAIAVDTDIDQGRQPTFKKRVAIRLRGGLSAYNTTTGDIYGTELILSVDVTDITHVFIDTHYVEYYSIYIKNTNIPSYALPVDADQIYLQLTTMALYGKKNDQTRAFIPYCNGQFENAECAVDPSGGSTVKYFVKPFEWLEGANATIYGGTMNETVMSMALQEYSPSIWALDGHQVSVGTFFGPAPLTLLYTTPIQKVDNKNTLQQTGAVALAWYGRGLTFSITDATALFTAIDWANPIKGQTNFTLIAGLTSRAIFNAWKEEKALGGDQPGVLAARASDGVSVPAIVLKYTMDTPTYVNHATARPVETALGKHRDIRDNQANARPPSFSTGLPNLKPTGKHLDSIALAGPSFRMDGYSVTWDVGVVWRFSIGFDPDAGLTIYNVRIQLPPTQLFPEGEIVPYLWRLNIPNFGQSYANSALGNIYSSSSGGSSSSSSSSFSSSFFSESHFEQITDLVPQVNCKGSFLTLPLYVSQLSSFLDLSTTATTTKFVYTSYGLDGFFDPYAKQVLGVNLPMNIFPIKRDLARSGAVERGICIQEVDEGNSLWHTYTAQRLRSLHVFGTSITEAYNVVNHFDFLSNGNIRVAEKIYGKPAQMGHGLNGAGGAFGSEGRGGFAANHLHWHVVAMEPNIRKNIVGVKNSLKYTDLIQNSIQEDLLDWYGTAQHRVTLPILNSSLSAANNYDFTRQRAWLMSAEDKEGKSLGGLQICTQAFGPPLSIPGRMPGRYAETSIPPEKTSLNQWWLQHDVFVSNANWTRSKQVLLSPSESSACSIHQSTSRCVSDETLGGSPVVYAVMRKYHHVTSDELPVQNGFTNLEMIISPMNLFSLNPNILSRMDPAYAAVFQNPPGQAVYSPPYSTEYEL